VTHHAEKRNITPEVLWAIIKKESAFEPVIISYANAYGLMQIIPPTARQIARELKIDFNDMRLLYNPDINIEMGTYYITELLKRYEWNLYYALAAYNAGPHRVDRWQKIIDTSDDDFFMENIEFSETRRYVRVVMRYYWTYYLILHPQEIPDDVFSFPKKLTREQWYNDLKRN
jgi:soluble lytic murein transglycosylase